MYTRMQYDQFLSVRGSLSGLSSLQKVVDAFGMNTSYVLMGGGLPNPETFPIKSGTFKLSDGSEIVLDEDDMAKAMQYGCTTGFPRLRAFIEELTKRQHDPPTWNSPDSQDAPRFIIVNGALDGINRTLDCLVDEDDVVLTSEPTYASFISSLLPFRPIVEAVKTDTEGIIPESLTAALSKYIKQTGNNKHVTRKVKLLYCVPNGDNPTGIRFSEARKREIYSIAQEYNFLILEDDAYYFLEKKFRETGTGPVRQKVKLLYCVPNGDNPTGIRFSEARKREIYSIAQEYNFLILEDDAYYFLERRPLIASFLSMDVDGRVLRLDTFSKTVGPGLRVGYITGPSPLLKRIMCVTQGSNCQTSQVILWKLCQKWGIEGYLRHCERVCQFYDRKREICLNMAEKYLAGLADWSVTTGGMFVWIKLRGVNDANKFAVQRLMPRKLILLAGSHFHVDQEAESPYVRVSFSMVSKDDIEKGFKILAEELKKYRLEQLETGSQ